MEACDGKKLTNINTTPKTLEELEDLLKAFNIDTSEWTKSVSTLLKEIAETDCYLSVVNGQLERFVDVARIRCYYRDQQLFEEKQVFQDKVRERNQDYVGEKMKKDEDPCDAAVRGVFEELQIVCSKNQLTPNFSLNTVNTYNPNPSYKGLQSSYRYFNFSVEFEESQFNPNGYEEFDHDKTTYFTWRKRIVVDEKPPEALLLKSRGNAINENERSRYAKYNIISQLPQDEYGIKVRCYTDGLKWICPNPENEELAEIHYQRYCQGFYLNFTDYYISRSDYDNASNWTS